MNVASVSAVIPTYNDAERLGESLGAILLQSDPPQEVVVCDDCSTDNTEEVVATWAGRVPSIAVRYLRMQENVGVVGARNSAIRAASGDWIASCDSDDVWLPEKLQKQKSFLSEWNGRPISVLGTYGYNVSDAGRILSLVTLGPKTEEIFEAHKAKRKLFYMLHSSIMFPRACFDRLGGYSSEYGIDECDFCTKMAELGVLVVVPEPLVRYRKRFGSMQGVAAADKDRGRRRLAANWRRAGEGLPPLSAEEFQSELDAVPLYRRVRRRARAFGRRHYRVGAVSAVNGQPVRGALHLLVAAVFARRHVSAGVRRAFAAQLQRVHRVAARPLGKLRALRRS
jgi:glycosyltransferase involved in cell wall biosynthesis